MTALAPADRRFRRGERYEVGPRPGGGRSRLVVYLTVRLTGLALAVLVLGHFALTHVVTDVADADAGFIARRWSAALWIAWDWLMLATALVHGAAGAWVAIEDYTPDRRRRRRRQAALTGASAVMLALGTLTLAIAGGG
jgi:succinate dehydrogenase / fumarate reductase membrane anchor subunit